VPLATAPCKNLPAENTERQFSGPKPTRVAVPIGEGGGEEPQIPLLFLWTEGCLMAGCLKHPENFTLDGTQLITL